VINQSYWYCDSENGRLYVDQEPVIDLGEGSFIRGLAMNDEVILLGVSEKAERKERVNTSCRMIVFNHQFQQTGSIALRDCGQVHEIRFREGDRCLSNYGQESEDAGNEQLKPVEMV